MALKRQPFKKIGAALKEHPFAAMAALGSGFVGGPALGLAVGGATGLLEGRARKSELDRRTAEAAAVQSVSRNLTEQIMSVAQFARTDLERERLAGIATQQANLEELAASAKDPDARQRALEGLANLQADVDGYTSEFQKRADADRDNARTFVTQGLEQTRKQQLVAHGVMANTQDNVDELYRLLNDPNFDPNKPLDRSRALQLVSTQTRSFMADPEGLDDALQSVGGAGLAGSLLSFVGGYIGAQEFQIDKGDLYRIAAGMQEFANRGYQRETARNGAQADLLGAAAQKSGLELPVDPRAYVLGAPEEFKPLPQLVGGVSTTPEDKAAQQVDAAADAGANAVSSANAFARGAGTAAIDAVAGEGATSSAKDATANALEGLGRVANYGGGGAGSRREANVAGADMTVTPPELGSEYPTVLRDLYERIARLAPGTVVRFNADTGDAFAVDSATLEARPMEVTSGQREALRRLRALREQRAGREVAQ